MEEQRSIITIFKKTLWSRFTKAIREYDLIQDNDKIAVCVSGGKDSMLLALLMKELHEHGKQNFSLEFLTIDPGYSKQNKTKILQNAKKLGIDLHVFKTNIYGYVATVKEGSPCYLCARMRRGTLYSKAKELGCNKIALGHHFDDVIETTLMSMLYNGQFKTMMPKLHSENFEGLELIRPLYKIRERDVIAWKKANNLEFINCACRFTEMCELQPNDESASKRKEMKLLIEKMEKKNKLFIDNIFSSLKNVNLETVLGYTLNDEYHNFADDYSKKKWIFCLYV